MKKVNILSPVVEDHTYSYRYDVKAPHYSYFGSSATEAVREDVTKTIPGIKEVKLTIAKAIKEIPEASVDLLLTFSKPHGLTHEQVDAILRKIGDKWSWSMSLKEILDYTSRFPWWIVAVGFTGSVLYLLAKQAKYEKYPWEEKLPFSLR